MIIIEGRIELQYYVEQCDLLLSGTCLRPPILTFCFLQRSWKVYKELTRWLLRESHMYCILNWLIISSVFYLVYNISKKVVKIIQRK